MGVLVPTCLENVGWRKIAHIMTLIWDIFIIVPIIFLPYDKSLFCPGNNKNFKWTSTMEQTLF